MTKELKTSPGQMPALVLAYIGDAIYEVYVRRYLISRGLTKVSELHKRSVAFVNAATQAKIVHALEGKLAPDEVDVVKRGRNAKSGTVPKNMGVIDYRYGTAFESLFGYLYLCGKTKRLEEIFALAVRLVEGQECEKEFLNDGEGFDEGKAD